MFGYIKINKDEMKIKDYRTYKAVYCSLCRELGKEYGLAARLTLNYDFTFLAVLRLALAEEAPCFKDSRCSFNPLVKCKKCAGPNRDFSFATAAAMGILYYKLLDNVEDERRLKRLAARGMRFFFRRRYKKAAASYGELVPVLEEMRQAQSKVEKEKPSLDAAAHPTATALGKLFAMCSKEMGEQEILYRLGYCLGRYVYFMDAFDDYDQDLKAGAFNAFAVNGAIATAPETIRHSAGEAVGAYYLLTPARYGDILENILVKGLNNTLVQVMSRQTQQRKADAI